METIDRVNNELNALYDRKMILDTQWMDLDNNMANMADSALAKANIEMAKLVLD